MMKKRLIQFSIVLVLAFVHNYGWADCGSPNNRLEKSGSELTIDLNQLLNTKEVLAKYHLDKEKEQQIETIIDLLGAYMKKYIDVIIDDNLHRKRTAVEEKAYSVVPQLDRNKTNKLKLWNKFRNGKLSPFSLESRINEQIESYNDKHLYNRLHTVSLKLNSLGSFLTDSFYARLVSDEWESEKGKLEIECEILTSYCKLFQSEKLIEQMIGIAD